MISEGAVEAVLFAMQIKENAAIQVRSLIIPSRDIC
jgi:hypothetical protein